ncbi:MAG: DUF1211 domain-containing protein [Methanomicrobium sp.]|nr:DUF1211 domain-containing protein [Methanomicrobium sp.]
MIHTEKNRLEAFSDGVLAIIITIMILELKLPAGDTFSDLAALTPTLLAYVLSFFFIAIYWVNHHLILHDVATVNRKILWCNIAWLFVMSFIPFGTAWVGSYPDSWAPVTLYFADMFLACVTFHLMYYLIACENCNAGGKGKNSPKFRLSPRNIISLVTYFLAMVLGGFYPFATYVIVAIVSAWWIFPEGGGKGGASE